MSAFVVEDKTINRVVSFLASHSDSDPIRRLIREETGMDLTVRDDQAKLAQQMFALNCNAVEQRYGEGEAASFRDLNFAFRKELRPTIAQAYTSLRCWLYQCSEGDVPDTSLLYATMERVSDRLAHSIARKTADVERAEWG